MSLQVLEPGLYTLVVDTGRPASRSLGVAVGGAADRRSLALGNALVSNPPDAAALEVCLAGPTLRTDCELTCVLYGAPFQLTGDRHREPLRTGKTFTWHADETLHIGAATTGMRAYLCVHGGFCQKAILGSQSALAPIRTGDQFECQDGMIASRSIALPHEQKLAEEDPLPLRVISGAQADWFRLDDFHAGTFTVTPASNRMGLRLQGPPLKPASEPLREMVSEAVCPGAVQVTRDGQCIILGVDGQTIGGYPKVAHVITADQDKLGQLRPGQTIRFRQVTLDEAESLHHQAQAELREWIMRLRVVSGE